MGSSVVEMGTMVEEAYGGKEEEKDDGSGGGLPVTRVRGDRVEVSMVEKAFRRRVCRTVECHGENRGRLA